MRTFQLIAVVYDGKVHHTNLMLRELLVDLQVLFVQFHLQDITKISLSTESYNSKQQFSYSLLIFSMRQVLAALVLHCHDFRTFYYIFVHIWYNIIVEDRWPVQ